MQDTSFSVDHIAELRRIEKARLRRGEPGLGPDFSALIQRLTSGGVSPGTAQAGKRRKGGAKLPPRDPRILQQTKVLWNKGWGQRLNKGTFEAYLLDIPEIPTFPAGYDERFPHLVLVDRRIQVVEACKMLGVSFGGDSTTFVSHDPTKSVKALIYWMRVQDGKLHRNHKPSVCRTEFASKGDEFGLEAHEGLALYAQSPDLLEINTAMDLPGSVLAVPRGRCAYLERWPGGDVKLDWPWNDAPNPGFGSASRGSAPLNP